MVRAARGILSLTIVLAISFLAIRWGQADESPTTDEWAHFIRGVACWQTGDSRLSFAHPPLANLLTAVPAVLDGKSPNIAEFEHWDTTMDPGRTSVELLEAAYPEARDGLMAGRKVMTWIFLAGVVYVYAFVRRVAGATPACLACVLIAWNPAVVAQARYVTTDIPAAVTMTIAIGELVRFLTRRPPTSVVREVVWPTVRLSLAVGLALATKHSAVVLVVIVPATVLTVAMLRRGVFTGLSRSQSLRCAGARLLGGVVIVLLVINAAYGFRGSVERVDEIMDRPEPQYWISAPHHEKLLETRSLLRHLPDWFRVPLPYTYVFGVACVSEQMRIGYPRGVFLGEPNRFGNPLYFPFLFAVKTPLWILVAFFLGIASALRSRRLVDLGTWVVVSITTVLTVLLIASRLNMGIRHAMPHVFLLSVSAALLLRWPLAKLREARGWVQLAVVAGVSAWALGTLFAAGPHYLGWFNVSLSRERGAELAPVGDDWGQDVAALAEVVKEDRLFPFYYYHSGHTRRHELEYLGVKGRVIECRTRFRSRVDTTIYVALHVHDLQAWGDRCFRWRYNVVSERVINQHIVVHEVRVPAQTAREVWEQFLRSHRGRDDRMVP